MTDFDLVEQEDNVMPCIRCGKITVKLCTCSIVETKEAFSAWSEVEVELLINMLRMVLKSRQSAS
jgi:hypothetical protein